MEEYYILDKNFQRIYPLDTYTSLIWTDRYYECGDFEITAPFSADLYRLFQLDAYIWNSESPHLMMIETVRVSTDVETGNTLYVSGRSTEGAILDRRIIWGRSISQGNFQNAIENLLNENVIRPTDSKRKIPNIEFKRTNDSYINSLYVNKQEIGETLYETIQSLCKASNVGFKMSLVNDSKLVFELYYGIDRSLDQVDRMGVIFSPMYDNLINSSFVNSHVEYRNVALVGGEGEGAEQKFQVAGADSLTGLLRREIYVDGSDISSLIKAEEEDVEDPDFGDSIIEQLNNYQTKLDNANARKTEIARERQETTERLNQINEQLSDPNLSTSSEVYYQLKLDAANANRTLKDLLEEEAELDSYIPLYESKIKELNEQLGNIEPGGIEDTREDLYKQKIRLERELEENKSKIEELKSRLPDIYEERVEVRSELSNYEKEYSDASQNLTKLQQETQDMITENAELTEQILAWQKQLVEVQKKIDEWESEHGSNTTNAAIEALQREKAEKEARLKEIETELKNLEHPENPSKPGTTTNAFDYTSIYKEYSGYLDKRSTSEKKLSDYSDSLEEEMNYLDEINAALENVTEGSLEWDKLKLEKITTEKEIARLEVSIEEEENNIIEYDKQIKILKKKLDSLTAGSNEEKREKLYKEQYEINLRLDIIEEQLSAIDGSLPQFYQEKIDLKSNIESANKTIISNNERILENNKKIEQYKAIIRDHPAKIKELRDRLDYLNLQISIQEGDSYVSDIENQIADLRIRNREIEKEIERIEESIGNVENPPTAIPGDKYLTDEQYRQLLIQRGLEGLADKRTTLMFDGKVEPRLQYTFGVDYQVGDIVQLENEYGMSNKTRIIEYVISHDTSGSEAYPTFAAVT